MIEGSGYVAYSAWPPSSLSLNGAGIFQSCTYGPRGNGRCVLELPADAPGLATITTTYQGTAYPITTFVVDTSNIQQDVAGVSVSPKVRRYAIIGGVVGVVLIVLGICLCFALRRRKSSTSASASLQMPTHNMHEIPPMLVSQPEYTPFQPYHPQPYPPSHPPSPPENFNYPSHQMSIPMPQPTVFQHQSPTPSSFNSMNQSFNQNLGPSPPAMHSISYTHPHAPAPHFQEPASSLPSNRIPPGGHEQIIIGANNITQLSWSSSPAPNPQSTSPNIIRTDTSSTIPTPPFATPPTSMATSTSKRDSQGYFPPTGYSPSNSSNPSMYPSDSKAHLRQQLRDAKRPSSSGSGTQTIPSSSTSMGPTASSTAMSGPSAPSASTSSRPSSSAGASTAPLSGTGKGGKKGDEKGGFKVHNSNGSVSDSSPPAYSL